MTWVAGVGQHREAVYAEGVLSRDGRVEVPDELVDLALAQDRVLHVVHHVVRAAVVLHGHELPAQEVPRVAVDLPPLPWKTRRIEVKSVVHTRFTTAECVRHSLAPKWCLTHFSSAFNCALLLWVAGSASALRAPAF